MNYNWNKLQNGSDIRGVALPLIEDEKVNLDSNIANTLGKAFAIWLSKKIVEDFNKMTIGIGMDSRLSGPDLNLGLVEGITSLGCKVLDFGLATTPAMFMSTRFDSTKCDGGIMITASHLPPNRNGMKFFTSESGLEKQDISQILEIAENNEEVQGNGKGKVIPSDILTPYSEHLINFIRQRTKEKQPLHGLKIIVDAGNGAGGFFADKVLKPLGAITTGSQFLNPDGNFPNHTPNPEDNEAMQSICSAVLENNADLGIIFDTDVDRSAIVDKSGRAINRNALIALLSAIVLEEHPGTHIVTDSVTSDGLTKYITNRGGKHHRFKRGYRNVINESIRLNNEGDECWLAIETSGHGAMKENYNLDDGAYMVAKALVKMAQLKKEGKNLTSLIESLDEPKEAKEFRIKIKTENFNEYGNSVIAELEDYVGKVAGWEKESVNYEGIRVKCKLNGGSGWFLLRLSLHDPILPLNIESDIVNGIQQITDVLIPFFNKFNELSNTSLT